MKMLAVVLAILSYLSVILKLELRNLSKGITSPIFLSIYTLPQHAFFKIINKANSKFDLKIKEVFRINWKKTNLNAQQNHLALTLSLKLPINLVKRKKSWFVNFILTQSKFEYL